MPLGSVHAPCTRIRQASPQPTPSHPLAPFSSFLAFSFVLFFLSGLLGGHPGSFSQCTPCPPPAPLAPLAPFSSFLAFSFVLFFPSGLQVDFQARLVNALPHLSPPHIPATKREHAVPAFCVCPHLLLRNPALNNSPLVDKFHCRRG